MWPLSHAGPGARPGTPPALRDSGSAERRPSRAQPSPLPLSPPPGPPGARLASTEPGAPHTRQSRVPGLRPPRQLPPLWTPAPAGARVTVWQGQSAAGPGPAEGPRRGRGRRRGPRRGRGRRRARSGPRGRGARPHPKRGRKGWGPRPKLAGGSRRGAPPDPGSPPRTPRRSRTFLRGARSDFRFPAPRNPLRRARRGVRASRRASRVRAPRYPASPPLDLDPRPHRDPDPDVRTHQRSPRARNCLPAGRRGCRRPAPEPA
ncbi:PREDICTED: basic proline-rich protein-like [Capra hircus]|uniref:basic proline-rich protein-like n=1 Tax=Capra hircus TaxID=9925 RepID=UPI0008469119|nr:PREDICTED: basic proline-rich protein-like [Capra hircus]